MLFWLGSFVLPFMTEKFYLFILITEGKWDLFHGSYSLHVGTCAFAVLL